MEPDHAGRSIAFRHLLDDALRAFLGDAVPAFASLASPIGELSILLSRYREEGAALFPQVFVCDALGDALAALDGADPLFVGRCTFDVDGVRRALKRTAPLAGVGWSIFFEVRERGFRYGLFRTDGFVLHQSPMDRLRALQRAGMSLVGLFQLEDSVVSIHAASGASRSIYLSGARVDAAPAPSLVERLAGRFGGRLAPVLREGVVQFWRRVLLDSLRLPHGTLVAVVDDADDVRGRFGDAAILEPALDVPSLVERYQSRHDEPARAAVYAAATLASGMLGADGITVVRSDGAALGYNAFIRHREAGSLAASGGARRRTYEALAADVGHGLVAAFYRSQDGATALAVQDE